MGDSKKLRYYPPVGFHFEVYIIDGYDGSGRITNRSSGDHSIDASFQEVSGINVEIPTQEFYEGGENRFAYRLPLPMKYSPLQLKRGFVASSSALGEWCKKSFAHGLDQPIEVKNLLVSLLDEVGTPLMSWVFIAAFPTKLNVSSFNAKNNEIVVETMELSYRRFEQVKVS